MGDRTITICTCPLCGKKYECYDAPSSVMYVAICDNCGYEEPDYYIEKKRKLSELERDLIGKTHVYDPEMKKHTKKEMGARYREKRKEEEWIKKALDVDYSKKKERFVDIIDLKRGLEKKKRHMVKFDTVLKMVLECEVK